MRAQRLQRAKGAKRRKGATGGKGATRAKRAKRLDKMISADDSSTPRFLASLTVKKCIVMK
eukprot:SAG31_NODE_532_length_14374_cov_30.565254_9_plen_61_part_00